MAKSKEQKQQEALQRKRDMFDSKSIEQRRYQVGGDIYEHLVSKFGREEADNRKREVDTVFTKYLVEAQLDRHGNPVAPKTKQPKWETSPKHDNGAIHSYLEELENERW